MDTESAPRDDMAIVRLAMRLHLHPEDELHPSWLPPQWPQRHRRTAALGRGGRGVLGELLRSRDGLGREADYRFESRTKRLALVDGPSLRLLAALTGWCAHAPLLLQRGAVGTQMRRQAARYGDDVEDFVRERAPRLTALRMDPQPLEQHPWGAGRTVVGRGYRLLLGTVAAEGADTLERVRRKLPHRLSRLRLPTLSAVQRAQVEELMLLCIVPERLPQWDWLF